MLTKDQAGRIAINMSRGCRSCSGRPIGTRALAALHGVHEVLNDRAEARPNRRVH
jgi:hypothetical protein